MRGGVIENQFGRRDFGPGEAKLQFKERLSRSKALSETIVGVETSDKLTDPQIVAKMKKHYGIDR